MLHHFPNLLTFSRILAAPLLAYAVIHNAVWMALGVLLFSMITDFYDGRIARRYNLVSKTGSFLDPLADKVIIISGFSALCYSGVIPLWVVLVIAGRDIFITGLRSVVLLRGYELQTSWLAKSKTALQFIALHLYIIGSGCLHGAFGYIGFSFKLVMYRMIEATSVIVALVTLFSGLVYLWGIKKRVKPQKRSHVQK